MSAGGKSRTEELNEFLVNFLPWGVSTGEHELVAAMIMAARAHLATRLRDRGHLRPEDEDD